MLFGEKLPKKMPTNPRGTPGITMCAVFYPKIEELGECRSPSLLFLREPKKALSRMANLGQTKGPFSRAPFLPRAQELMFSEKCSNRINTE